MIRGQAIRELVGLLERRGAALWHACQYRDYQSYLELGGIPSRAILERSGKYFTSFETDLTDHTNGVWDKVFVNLSDFGRSFAAGGKAVPNPYGPIVLRISPQSLHEAADVAICLRSAGGRRFNRESESLKTVSDVDCLFLMLTDFCAVQATRSRSNSSITG
jgi:hypothetical protein